MPAKKKDVEETPEPVDEIEVEYVRPRGVDPSVLEPIMPEEPAETDES